MRGRHPPDASRPTTAWKSRIILGNGCGPTTEPTFAQIRLTPTEWRFIEILIRHIGRLVTRQTILTTIWGTEHAEDTGYLRLYVSQLSRKLGDDTTHPVHLITEPGMGYPLEGMTR
ncbi:winged helix-turn-helix domain-containing protein [Micrococcus yunnanensis]|uniref:winged helix-turn-helix domain-containing protein n=1 Tax=Micrococcus TaxID=1269 RepID=UPI0008A15C84|nr:winged helix-turn-helix domain-containing protein [Micrococcus yunnanensis]OFS17690.1 hypothetical protein HMPREF3105_00565 [Micrococcus sp. HMSC31B01]TFU54385.1 winged helix family transcriptional regulator [Micrococcus yunnanensis]